MLRRHFLIPALALALTPAVTAQTVQTMPNTLPTSFGGNAFPFGGVYANSEHCQFIYDGSNINFKGPVLIQRLRFRSTAACNGGSATNVTIKLSQCPLPWNAISKTYAANMTPATTVTVLNNGTANFTKTAGAGWAFDLQLKTPYLYDPTKGPLCFDWERLSTGTLSNGFTAAIAGNSSAPLKGSRTYGPSGQATAAGTTTGSYGYACAAEVTWIPAAGLYSSFTSDKTEGPGPLTVQFKDTTYTSNGPVTSWAWDFDGDSKIDSKLQNPSFTYPKTTWDATYDVSLTTTDGTNPPSKVTYKAYITVDPSNATAIDFGKGSTNKPVSSPIGQPVNTSIYSSSSGIRGFHFIAPTTFVIIGFEAPNDATPKEADQTVVCYVMPKQPASNYTATAADVKFYATAKANTILKPTKPIIVNKGEWVGVFGACHATTASSLMRNAYATGGYKTTVLGQPITINRLWMNSDPRVNKGLGPINPSTGSIARVFVYVSGNTTVPLMTTSGLPKLGATPQLDMQAKFAGAQGGVVFLSGSRLPVPVPTLFGNLLITPSILASIFVPTGTGMIPLPIPNSAALTGTTLDWQGMAFDMSTMTFGMTNGTEWFIGK